MNRKRSRIQNQWQIPHLSDSDDEILSNNDNNNDSDFANLRNASKTKTFEGKAVSLKSCDEFQFDELAVANEVSNSDNNYESDTGQSIMDGLLFEIYDRWHGPQRDSFDSDTFTECSSMSEAFLGRSDSLNYEFERTHSARLSRAYLESKDVDELRTIIDELRYRTNQISARLIRQLKRRDRRIAKLHKNYDLVTAILQAASQKRRIDTRMKFSVQPLPGESAWKQWLDAMKAVARLPLGMPKEFRKKVWLNKADRHLGELKIDWEKTKRFAFNEKSNPDDKELGLQIVKDLHRTGCSGFSGHDNEEERAVLKRVLLAYARWNKRVGYCQGFNIIAALILDVMETKEDDALKVMILLIDHVLPESYFVNNLRALSVDMAVFRDLLRVHLPALSKHLDRLQLAARDDSTGASYEPPLTNVFTMQWFLTLFATCLPKYTALRVWDSVFLEGSEILIRTALAIWAKLSPRILKAQSADEFYTTMGALTQEMMADTIIDADDLVKTIYNIAPFPFPQLAELREKYTYNITPFQAAMSVGKRPLKGGATGILSDDDDGDEDLDVVNCFGGILGPQSSPGKTRSDTDGSFDMSKISPGAYGAIPGALQSQIPAYLERMNTDIHGLKRQYTRLKERQKQAHIFIAAAASNAKSQKSYPKAALAPNIESPVVLNHLFVGRKARLGNKNRCVTDGPRIAPIYSKSNPPAVAKENVIIKHKVDVNRKVSNASENSDHIEPKSSESSGNNSPSVSPPSEQNDYVGLDLASLSSEQNGYTKLDLETAELSPLENKPESLQQAVDKLMIEEDAQTPQSVAINVQDCSDSPQISNTDVNNTQSASNESAMHAKPDSTNQNTERPQTLPISSQRLNSSSNNSEVSGTRDESPSHQHSAMYVAKMTYKTHKKSQERSPAVSPNHSSTISPSNISPNSGASPSRTPSPGASPKPYNPFPTRHMNPNRAKNGMKLGLYSSKGIPGVPDKKTSPIKNIGRSQINACLHRQYMAEVKAAGKSQK
ncbi:unnamed protein product [Owenia fusiformis]|uniref:TBC1 domain family member 30 n=1 Tax=Owenia fusiformis TaxID=6347 RepID=A0A8J1T706_OWEFU|nr:unnamed protein product [Owenia fusiformis]